MDRNNILKIEELTSLEIADIFDDKSKKNGLILPVGCTEQHGCYLPIGCDTIITKKAALVLAKNLLNNDKYRAFVLPEVCYTPSPGAEFMAGTVSVSFDLLGQTLNEIITGCAKGINPDFFLILNGHAHNHGRVIEASIAGSAKQFNNNFPVLTINVYDFFGELTANMENPGNHAGELEIALYKYYSPEYPIASKQVKSNINLKRPKNIYGLDISKRSYEGIISEKLPDINRAISISNEAGNTVDNKILETLKNNLDIYFDNWTNKEGK